MDYEPDRDPGKEGAQERNAAVPDDITAPERDPRQSIVEELENIVQDWADSISTFSLYNWEREDTKQRLETFVYHSDEAEEAVKGHPALEPLGDTAHRPGAILSMAHNEAANRVISYDTEFETVDKPPFMLGKFLDADKILLLDAPTTAPGDRNEGLVVNRDEINGWVGGDTLINLGHIDGIDDEYHGLSDKTILNYGNIDRNAHRAINVDDEDLEQYDEIRDLYSALNGSLQDVQDYFSDIDRPREHVEELVDRAYGGDRDGV